jgi:tetratricopeptide (TPR) repeat protein
MPTRLAVSALLVTATLAVYLQVREHRFVDVDDLTAIVVNPDLRASGPGEALGIAARSVLNANWVPLTVISLQVSHALHGLEPAGYLLTNLALHAAAAVILFLALVRLSGGVWASAFVAGVFALHPLHVESVAWAAMRKDSLSALFWMLTLLAYARYAERPGPGRYAQVALFLVASLLAKPVAVTLPFVLLLLDYWPLGRLAGRSGVRRALLEKLPLLVPVAIVCVVTIVLQRDAGALTDPERLPMPARVWNAVDAYAVYLAKSFWPSGLAVFYPHPVHEVPGAQLASDPLVRGLPEAGVALRALGLAAITATALGLARSRPYLAVGWLWFLGTLVPMIGLVQVGIQARADRYTYLPLIGLSIAAAWGAAELLRRRRALLAVAGVAALAALGITAAAQVTHWRNAVALHARAVAVTRDNQLEHHRLANALRLEGRFEEALPHYLRAVELAPDARAPHIGLGDVYFQLGRLEEAAASYRRGVALQPGHTRGRANLGITLLRLGHPAEARVELERALALQEGAPAPDGPPPPALATAHLALADALLELGQPEQAIPHYRRALAIDPARSRARRRLGVALVRSGHFAEARPLLARTLARGGGSAQEEAALARALAGRGRPRQATRHYRAALALAPDSRDATRELAWILATSPDASLRQPQEAVRLMEEVLSEPGGTADLLDTLATAYAAAGRYDDAVRTAERALDLAGHDPERSAAIRGRRDLFRSGRPYLEPSRAASP